MSFLFINEKDIEDLKEEIEEDFGLKPSKDNSKDNKEKKQTVEERIIQRCQQVQKKCSSIIDVLPYYGAARKAIEYQTGKDYITEEELTPTERAKRGKEVVEGIESTVADICGLKLPKRIKAHRKILNLAKDILLEDEKGRESVEAKNN